MTTSQETVARAMDDLKRRIENCIQDDGRHLMTLFFILEYLTQMACLDL